MAADDLHERSGGVHRRDQQTDSEDALTGPIARGDRRTVETHLDALDEHLPHLIPVYAALGTEAVRVAVRSGRLAPDAAQHVLDALHDALGL